jgi:hypothetical protein
MADVMVILLICLPLLLKGDKGGFAILKSLSISLYERERNSREGVSPLLNSPI